MSQYVCQYCNNTFSRTNNLIKHQKKAQYCLVLQANTEVEAKYECEYCSQSFTRKDSLSRHYKVCKIYTVQQVEKKARTTAIEDQNKMLLDLITQLQENITNVAGRPAVNNNRQVVLNNLQPLTEENLQEHLEHLTLNFIQEGAKGYAAFANSYPFKNRVMCTDKARKKLKYKDGDGEVIEDGGGVKLAQKFFQAIAPRNEEIINIEYRALHEKVQQIAKDGTAYHADLTGLLTKATHLQELLIKCREAARGEENELTREFVSHLSKML
ncbi:hypothetical protein LCGC14_2229680 [marine sediment metagenome]|uniref:C2H2-type domain-containing protein n=1 Tax=marine sediment metagenome TaxID=412755 RepID=A0A0F9FL71_9ZZZZ